MSKGDISYEFTCKCKKMKGWITEGVFTKPCPMCGRVYFGEYDNKKCIIKGIVQKKGVEDE